MVELKFDDYTITKYLYIGEFKEGLGIVKNRDGLWGYIDKNGNEVIPCQFIKAYVFSEGLAIVYHNENQAKIINNKGEILKETEYTQIKDFNEGLAAVINREGLWGYIDKNGNEIIPCQFDYAFDFRNGYAVIGRKGSYSYINAKGELFGKYHWISSFEADYAIVQEEQGKEIYSIDREFQKKYKFENNWRAFEHPLCNLTLWENPNCKWGYLNKELKPAIANMFDKARDFKEDVAIIEIKRMIGFVDINGKITAFSKEAQYTEIRDFFEGLAAVKNSEGLWGFIDKNGNEVIPCQYKLVDDFSEGLSGVLDENGELYYINKKGTRKISLDKVYCSTLELEDKIIYIKAETKEELLEKKIQVLNQVKEERIKQVINDITDISTDIMGDMYDLPKKRKRTNKETSK